MATTTKTKQKNAVTTTKKNVPTTSALDAAARYAGMGISDRQEDNIVPLVYLLQSNSPQVQRGNQKQIRGAEAGDIWLRNAAEDIAIVKGEDGLVFQPCHLNVCWIEWMPDRGGFVARHPTRPETATLEDKERDDGTIVKVWRMPNGNTVNESREYAGFAHVEDQDEPLPYTIPFASTGLTVAKQWMTTMRSEKLPNGERAPLFANLYRLRTKLRTKGKYSWNMYEISKEGPVQTVEDIERGAALYDAFATGAKQSAVIDAETATDAAAGEVDD